MGMVVIPSTTTAASDAADLKHAMIVNLLLQAVNLRQLTTEGGENIRERSCWPRDR